MKIIEDQQNQIILSVQQKIIKGGFTRINDTRPKARLLLILIRPRRVAPPLESVNEFMNYNPEPSMTWDLFHIRSGA